MSGFSPAQVGARRAEAPSECVFAAAGWSALRAPLAALLALTACAVSWPDEDALARFQRGTQYPYVRLSGAYLFHDGAASLYRRLPTNGDWLAADLLLGDRWSPARTVGELTSTGAPVTPMVDRRPVIGYGANAAPEALVRKFAPEVFEGRAVFPVVPARLRNFDIVWMAWLGGLGAPPATIAWSPGTTVEVWVGWLDAAQQARMDATEGLGRGYVAGRLEGIDLELADGTRLDAAWIYVGLHGAYAPDGAPLAVARVPAAGRRFAALSPAAVAARAEGGAANSPLSAVLVHVTDPERAAAARERMRAACRPFALPATAPVRFIPTAGTGDGCGGGIHGTVPAP